MISERSNPQRAGIALGIVQVAHEHQAGRDVGADDVRPRNDAKARRMQEQEPHVEGDFLKEHSEHQAEEEPRRCRERSAEP